MLDKQVLYCSIATTYKG